VEIWEGEENMGKTSSTGWNVGLKGRRGEERQTTECGKEQEKDKQEDEQGKM